MRMPNLTTILQLLQFGNIIIVFNFIFMNALFAFQFTFFDWIIYTLIKIRKFIIFYVANSTNYYFYPKYSYACSNSFGRFLHTNLNDFNLNYSFQLALGVFFKLSKCFPRYSSLKYLVIFLFYRNLLAHAAAVAHCFYFLIFILFKFNYLKFYKY